jgi:hypothetical protein
MPTKRTGDTPKSSNKIRFVMLEADLSDGNLSELTAAITQALKPAAPTVRFLNGKIPAQLNGGAPAAPDEEDLIEGEIDDASETDAAGVTSEKAARTPRGPKKPPKAPEYLPDLITDLPGFKEFAKQKNPTSKNQQYLVAAYWLKKFGGTATVTADMIYTCYKTAPWPAGFNDWNQTFHNLVNVELMRRVGKGEFAINPTGEHQVDNGTV